MLSGKPLVQRVLERLAPQVASVVISCNRNADTYAQWAGRVVADAQPGRGPLEGVLAGLSAAGTDYVFACPGDAPLLSDAIVARLAAALAESDTDLALPHDGVQRQPLFLLAHRRIAQSLQRFLDAGGRAVHAFVDAGSCVVVDMHDERGTFVNVNTAAELAALAAAGHPKETS
jgi:molybdenum cofactor guanylyltransferase